MKKNFLAALLIICGGISNCQAASWHILMDVGNDVSVWYFDSSTVVKKAGAVTLWLASEEIDVKEFTKIEERIATTQKWTVNCKENTIQVLNRLVYDSSGKVAFTSNKPSSPTEVVPDTLGEALRQTACDPFFPKSKNEEKYAPLLGTKKEHADLYFQFMKKSK